MIESFTYEDFSDYFTEDTLQAIIKSYSSYDREIAKYSKEISE